MRENDRTARLQPFLEYLAQTPAAELQGRHDAAHLVAAAHFEVGRQKALQRVHDHQQRRDVRHKGFQRAVFEAEQVPGAQKE